MIVEEMVKIQISDDVTLAKELPVSSGVRITEKYLKGSKLEWYNKSFDLVFDDDFQNQYIAALHTAFANHHPFVVNPDDLWMLILQGLSIHVNQNSEKFRNLLVDFDGKKEIVVRHDGLIMGDEDNTWSAVFPIFESKITEAIKDENIAKLIVPSFSTTNEIDKTCFRIALMDITKSYFSYVVMTKCGIPIVYIDGDKQDWQKMLESINTLLPQFELSDWAKELSTIIINIINTYEGDVNKDFFQNIYKYQDMSGGDIITGWINDFFPYIVKPSWKGEDKIVKKITMTVGYRAGSLKSANFPSSISSVPFIWDYHGVKHDMNFFAGICGFNETEEGAIRPRKNFFIAYK